MPSLFRFLVISMVITGLGYGVMLALATLVEPPMHEMIIPIAKETFAL